MLKLKDSLIIKLCIAVVIGIIIGIFSNEMVIGIINTIKFILAQIIFFVIPLIILGFIAPALTKMKKNAGKMLFVMICLSYISSIGAAFFSLILGRILIPRLSIVNQVNNLKILPKLIFKVEIPPIMSVMSALILAILLGLAVVTTNSKKFEDLLNEFNNIILCIVNNLIIPILSLFIASTFACLSYEGTITKQLPIFLKIVIIVIIAHYVWLFILYSIAGFISKKNPFDLLKYYGPAYLTAIGTMSSAATLPMALNCAKKIKSTR